MTGLTDEELTFAITNKNTKADSEFMHQILKHEDCLKKKYAVSHPETR